MSLSDNKIVVLFKQLDQLGELSSDDLLRHFTGENIEALRLISTLVKEGMDIERVLSEKLALALHWP